MPAMYPAFATFELTDLWGGGAGRARGIPDSRGWIGEGGKKVAAAAAGDSQGPGGRGGRGEGGGPLKHPQPRKAIRAAARTVCMTLPTGWRRRRAGARRRVGFGPAAAAPARNRAPGSPAPTQARHFPRPRPQRALAPGRMERAVRIAAAVCPAAARTTAVCPAATRTMCMTSPAPWSRRFPRQSQPCPAAAESGRRRAALWMTAYECASSAASGFFASGGG